jgi:uncharacterized protein (DUF488 family)
MRQADQKVIWTIGHSTHSIEEFIAMLHSFQIQRLVDIRMFPGSRRYPHFNKELLEDSMAESNIEYNHMIELGGRRKPKPDSKNTGWRLASFKGYADYMETDAFKLAIQKLESLALEQRTVYMCSEAVWWRCHRALVSDYLKVSGWTVMHIINSGKAQEHPYTSPAKNMAGILSYKA